jgi:16S rRNA processing protein RimM
MLLTVGRIVRPHGIVGELIVEIRTDEPEQRFAPGSVLITDPGPVPRPAASGPRSGATREDGASRAPEPARAEASAHSSASGLTSEARREDVARKGPGRARAEASADNSVPGPTKLTVRSVRPHQGRLLVVFDGVHDRTMAESLRGVLLRVDSDDVPATDDPDEFHDHQLVGLAAVTPDGEALGEVVRVEHAPASELLVLRRPGGRTALVPFVKPIVPEVDLAGGRVVMTPPEGLFDL